MRQTPYHFIELPTLNRIINVCDEEGNKTFVFNIEELTRHGIEVEDVKDKTKPQLQQMIRDLQGVGITLAYNKDTFVDSIVQLLEDDAAFDDPDRPHQGERQLSCYDLKRRLRAID